MKINLQKPIAVFFYRIPWTLVGLGGVGDVRDVRPPPLKSTPPPQKKKKIKDINLIF